MNGGETSVWNVIPEKAGIRYYRALLDSRLRGSDDRDTLAPLCLTRDASYRTASEGGFVHLFRVAQRQMSYCFCISIVGKTTHR